MSVIRYVLELLRCAFAPIDAPAAAPPADEPLAERVDHIKLGSCPNCGLEWNGIQNLLPPPPGVTCTVLACARCAHLMGLENDGTTREITTEEIKLFARESPHAFQEIADWQQWVRSRPRGRGRLHYRSTN